MQSSDGKVVVGGNFTSIGGGGNGNTPRSRIARLNIDGTLDTSFDPGASPNQVSALAVQSSDGKIIVGGDFSFLGGGGFGTTPRSKIGRLNPDGTIDSDFNPGANGSISAILLQQDGKILIGGSFTMVGGGGSGTTARNNIARLNADGSLDTSFNPGANNTVRAFALQKDGKIIVVGSFTTLGGGGAGTVQRRSIARLNSDGSLDTSFDPGADNTINVVLVQPDGKIVIGGDFNKLGTTTRNFIGRLNPDGSLDAGFDPGTNTPISALGLQLDGGILVGGLFDTLGGGGTGTIVRHHIGRLKPDGSVDMSFNPGSDGLPHVFALQFDRKIIVGGAFSKLGELSGGPAGRNNIARLYPDGSVDSTLFLLPNGAILAIALQPDGKILIGGKFSMIGEVFRSGIARLTPDGRIDPTFSVLVLEAQGFSISEVDAIAVQVDGKIVIGGKFSSLQESGGVDTPRKNIARLLPNGSIDTTFDPGANDMVRSLLVQPDGKIVVGGRFTTLGGGGTTSRNRIGRLNSDGSIDNTFDPGANDQVNALALQRDGKMLIGGNFTTIGGGGAGTVTRNFLARLNSDTSVDTAFNPGANATVSAFAIQNDEKIIVAGGFTTLGGGGFGTTTHNRIGRLNPGGDLDADYVAGANGFIRALALQADGKLIVGGSFTTLGEGAGTKNRNKIGRFNFDGSVDESFDPGTTGDGAEVDGLAIQSDGKIIVSGEFSSVGSSGGFRNIGRLTNTELTAQLIFAGPTSIVWFNFGAGPEVARVTFESSTDGVNFTFLGAALPPQAGRSLSAAWALNNLSLPLSQRLFLRARSFFHTGQETGSFSQIETVNHVLFCPGVTVGPALADLNEGVAGSPYSQQFSQTGGTGSISFTKSAGVLPAGLTLNNSTGLLSGTPAESGTFEFTIEASDQNGCFGRSTYSLEVETGIRLSQPVYSTSEGVSVLTITANRVGDTAGPATVNFATSDTAGLTSCTVANGKASERCDYGTTAGTLRFAAGETTKSFIIPIVDDALVEGVETFTLTLSAATGATLGTPQTALLRIVDNDQTPATKNPVDGVDFFVTQQYIDFLGRLPDTIGFANWTATLNGCPNGGFGEFDNPDCDRVHVSAGFFLSTEFRERGYFAYRFYEVVLDRRPTYAEFVPDMVQVGGAQSPESEMLSKIAYTDAWTQRPEFKSRYDGLSNADFVNALEANAEVPLFNKAALIASLDQKLVTRAGVLRDVVDNPAVADRFFNRAFVAMQYFGYLRRDPDTIGFQNWVDTLNADPSNFRHMIFGFIYSTEYRQRFGP